MANLLKTLFERGFVDKTTHKTELEEYLQQGNITGYIGFDPTASSLHIGSLVPIMSLAHMQRHGHRPIAVVGGGTGLVGDPSGKTEMRQLLTEKSLQANMSGIKQQLSRFINFDEDKALLLNNADWLTPLNYIAFLRDFGRHFSVNRMLRAESYRIRVESEEGLNFIEFNYMLLQAYDFLHLFNAYGCRLQMGGSDQWGNIVAGIDLVRKMHQETAFGITFPLITTSSGSKMGKTAKGAIWLDKNKTTPYEYYQYWINTDDRDVDRFLALFTFLPMPEIHEVKKFQGADLNAAKTILAFEATQLAHGKKEALKAYQASINMFGKRILPKTILPSSGIHHDAVDTDDTSIPKSVIDGNQLKTGLPAFKIFKMAGLASSSSFSRRLIAQGGAYINGQRVESFDYMVTSSDVRDGKIILRSGKKRFHIIHIQ